MKLETEVVRDVFLSVSPERGSVSLFTGIGRIHCLVVRPSRSLCGPVAYKQRATAGF